MKQLESISLYNLDDYGYSLKEMHDSLSKWKDEIVYDVAVMKIKSTKILDKYFGAEVKKLGFEENSLLQKINVKNPACERGIYVRICCRTSECFSEKRMEWDSSCEKDCLAYSVVAHQFFKN